jgi:GTP-binding protein
LKPADDDVFKTLGEAAMSHQIVLTKADQVPQAELETRIAEVQGAIVRRAAAFPDVIATSAETGAGIPELRGAIARLLAERG